MPRPLRIVAHNEVGWHDDLFEYGPPTGLQRRLRLIRPGASSAKQRALIVIVITWLPIVALSTIDGGATTLTAAVVFARYLIAAPLLVLAETVCGRRLTAIARQFTVGNFVINRDHRRFQRIWRTTRALLQSSVVEIIAWAAAYAASGWFLGPLGGHNLGEWSVAMRWNALVSLPILLVLIFGWAWRLLLWCWFLLMVSRLELRLVASHPDRAGGVSFVGASLRAFAIVGFALATIIAGHAARTIVHTRQFSPESQQFTAALIISLTALLALPIVTLAPSLARIYRFALMDYGELAVDVGRAFEAKWLSHRSLKTRAAAFQEPDFSATTDLYQVVSNVHRMRLVPATLTDVAILVGATLLPFVPLVLLVVPANVVWDRLRDLLL